MGTLGTTEKKRARLNKAGTEVLCGWGSCGGKFGTIVRIWRKDSEDPGDLQGYPALRLPQGWVPSPGGVWKLSHRAEKDREATARASTRYGLGLEDHPPRGGTEPRYRRPSMHENIVTLPCEMLCPVPNCSSIPQIVLPELLEGARLPDGPTWQQTLREMQGEFVDWQAQQPRGAPRTIRAFRDWREIDRLRRLFA